MTNTSTNGTTGASGTDTVPRDQSLTKELVKAATASQVVPQTTFREAFGSVPKTLRWLTLVPVLLFLYALPWLGNPAPTWLGPLPFLPTTGSDFPATLTGLIIPYVLIALGLNVVLGQAGLLDLGYVGFFAIGAYTMGILTSKHFTWGGWLWLVAVILAVVITMLLGVLLGAPTLRLRGDYLAIVTLGFGEIIRIIAKEFSFFGAAEGISGIKSMPSFLWFFNDFHKTGRLAGQQESRWLWTVGLTVVFAVMFLLMRLENSRVGRAWTAIREDEDAAELMGVPTFTFKLWAFAIGAAVGGLGGAFYTTRNIAIYQDQFEIEKSVLFLAAVVLGGLGNRYGAVLGGFLVAYIPERIRGILPDAWEEKSESLANLDKFRYLFFGVVLVIMMIFRPQGLLPRKVKERGMAAFRDWSPATASSSSKVMKLGIAGLIVPFVSVAALVGGLAGRKKTRAQGQPEHPLNTVGRVLGVVGLVASLSLAWMLVSPRFKPIEQGDICSAEQVGLVKEELLCQDRDGSFVWEFDYGSDEETDETDETAEETTGETTADTTVAVEG
jgi:branched-chain amino acid transport system permease protein